MTLAEALQTLRIELRRGTAGGQVGEAHQTLRRELDRLVRGVTRSSEFWDAAASSVADKLVDQALSGDLPEIASPVAYLKRALSWRVCDLVRRAAVARRDLARQADQAADDEDDRAQAARREAAWRSLDGMYAIVRRAMDERHREPNEVAMSTLFRIHEHGETLKGALLDLDPELARNPEALERAAARVHKAQQRLRAALADETTAQVSAGRLTEDEGDDILWLLTTLRRRSPKAAPPRVSRT